MRCIYLITRIYFLVKNIKIRTFYLGWGGIIFGLAGLKSPYMMFSSADGAIVLVCSSTGL